MLHWFCFYTCVRITLKKIHAKFVVIDIVMNVLERFYFLFSKYVAFGKCKSVTGINVI